MVGLGIALAILEAIFVLFPFIVVISLLILEGMVSCQASHVLDISTQIGKSLLPSLIWSYKFMPFVLAVHLSGYSS